MEIEPVYLKVKCLNVVNVLSITNIVALESGDGEEDKDSYLHSESIF